jgi:hypothetical protein
MKPLLYFIFLISLTLSAQTKNDAQTFKVSFSDLKMTTYAKDSTANALVLYEYGNSYVDDEKFDLRTQRKHKVKIFNKEGFHNASIIIYLYKSNANSYETIDNILATTYNLEGDKVIKTQLDKANIYKEVYNENLIKVKFTLPNIKAGSVFTYSYELRSPYMRKYRGWNFQSAIPKCHSEYHTSIPANWVYHIKLVGGKKQLHTNDSKIERNCLVMSYGASADCTLSTYIMKDVPAFIEEDYMTSEDNYLARIEYELETFKGMDGSIEHYTKTWKDVDKELKGDIGRQLKKSVDTEKLLPESITAETDPLKKATAVFHFVQDSYTWNGKYGLYKDISVRDIVKNKSGNVSSLNILLHNLLKQNGIKVSPVILSTRTNGFATKIYPVITDFNYLVVQATINDTTYLLDATDKYLSFGTLPYRCLNGYGRLIKFKGESKWIDIKAEQRSLMQNSFDLKLDAQGVLTGDVNTRATGYHALIHKRKYFSNPETYASRRNESISDIEVRHHTVSDIKKTSATFEEHFTIYQDLEDVNGTIYFNPFLIPFFSENPFKLQNRSYPIDFGYKDKYTCVVKLNLGEHYELLESPKPVRLALPNKSGHITFSTSVIDTTINILFNISFNRSIYPSEYYPFLKEFMNKVVAIQTNSLLVLKKVP